MYDSIDDCTNEQRIRYRLFPDKNIPRFNNKHQWIKNSLLLRTRVANAFKKRVSSLKRPWFASHDLRCNIDHNPCNGRAVKKHHYVPNTRPHLRRQFSCCSALNTSSDECSGCSASERGRSSTQADRSRPLTEEMSSDRQQTIRPKGASSSLLPLWLQVRRYPTTHLNRFRNIPFQRNIDHIMKL